MAHDPVLFLDVDGVLNDHAWNEAAKSNGIDPGCVKQLNRVLAATGCAVVLSSAWRYMVIGRAMTLMGFEYLLRTHGVACEDRIIDLTRPDAEVPPGGKRDPNERGKQVRAWLRAHPKVRRYAVVDDLDLGFSDAGLAFVQTDGKVGLTRTKADRLIALLRLRRAVTP